jgi:hypothetical protein
MCDECDEISKTIARYQRLKEQINDKRLHEAAQRLVTELHAKKAGLHPA